MSITRAPRPESNFYILDKRISEDSRLSWGARGLLIFLLGKPDSWTVSVNHLWKETQKTAKPTGRDGVYNLLDELMAAGYVIRSQERTDSGGFSSSSYLVNEDGISPVPDLPLPDLPYTAKTTLVSIDLDQELIKSKTLSPPATKLGLEAKKKSETIPYERIRDIYNEVLGDIFRKAVSLDKARTNNIKKCWNLKVEGEYLFRHPEFWKAYFTSLRANDFLRGTNDRRWVAHLEYVTRESVVTSALEDMSHAAP